MIYWGSGSYSRKILVPALVPVPPPVLAPVPVLDSDLFSTVFNNKKFNPILAFSMLEAA
jgi:hypothetical protein